MRTISLIALLPTVFGPAQAQTFSPLCQPIFDEVAAENPINVDQCEVEVADYTLQECTPPTMFNSTRPTSHLILAIDASGSMAGTVGGQTKMSIAQAEAINFLSDLPDEIAVGLVVYGHEGDNTEAGRVESCGASEMVHGFDTSRSTLADTINSLTPTGWTPLGGVLDFAETVISDLPPSTDEDPIAPVIYLLSDGIETCDGTPVASAQALAEAGIPTTVNTIGFDVDAETAAQLEQIAEAGNGLFYAADSASALRDRLNSIKDAEAAVVRYEYCVDINAGRIAVVYHNAAVEMAGCFRRNDPARQRAMLFNAVTRLRTSEGPETACVEELNDHALNGYESSGQWFSDRATQMNETSARLVDEYRQSASLDALSAAE